MRPTTAKEAYDWGNASPPRAMWFSSSSGRIELAITLDDAHSGSHSGQCDDDISALRDVPYIAEQLDGIAPATLRDELREYGAWDDSELADHDQNLARILWLACGDIVDHPTYQPSNLNDMRAKLREEIANTGDT